jgi:hypothetical protein
MGLEPLHPAASTILIAVRVNTAKASFRRIVWL